MHLYIHLQCKPFYYHYEPDYSEPPYRSVKYFHFTMHVIFFFQNYIYYISLM